MTGNFLVKLFEHNNWANLQILNVCSTLTDEQLDAVPHSATKGTIRLTLWHLVSSQEGYLSLLTGMERRFNWEAAPSFADLQEAASLSGEGMVSLAKDELSRALKPRLQTRDGCLVEPWVVVVQAINHATEHREQIKSMLSSLTVTPPEIDGWDYGQAMNALVPITT
jgi:uncharacterized damage-inducible protein DinB